MGLFGALERSQLLTGRKNVRRPAVQVHERFRKRKCAGSEYSCIEAWLS